MNQNHDWPFIERPKQGNDHFSTVLKSYLFLNGKMGHCPSLRRLDNFGALLPYNIIIYNYGDVSFLECLIHVPHLEGGKE